MAHNVTNNFIYCPAILTSIIPTISNFVDFQTKSLPMNKWDRVQFKNQYCVNLGSASTMPQTYCTLKAVLESWHQNLWWSSHRYLPYSHNKICYTGKIAYFILKQISGHINGLVQEKHKSSADAVELLLFCTDPSISCVTLSLQKYLCT